MNKSTKIALALLVVVIIAGGIIALTGRNANKESKSSSSTSNSQSSNNQNNNSESSDEDVAVTITYDGNSFKSSADTIKSGQKVKVVNQSDEELDFDSDPHPVHTDDPELNAGDILGGGSKTFTLTKKGTWGYHNHLNPGQHGQITVE